jgi:hypothetical protein
MSIHASTAGGTAERGRRSTDGGTLARISRPLPVITGKRLDGSRRVILGDQVTFATSRSAPRSCRSAPTGSPAAPTTPAAPYALRPALVRPHHRPPHPTGQLRHWPTPRAPTATNWSNRASPANRPRPPSTQRHGRPCWRQRRTGLRHRGLCVRRMDRRMGGHGAWPPERRADDPLDAHPAVVAQPDELVPLESGDEAFDARWRVLTVAGDARAQRLAADPAIRQALLAGGYLAALRPDGRRPNC